MNFILLCVAALLCEISSNIPVGSMPLALVHEGATESSTSIAMGCGMFAALIISVPVGMLVDRIGRLAVLRIAAFSSVVIMLIMGCTDGIIAGCLQMAFRSAALVAYMTAQFAYASNMFSKERAVSAVATMGILGNVALASGPAFGVWLWQHGIHREQFMYAAVLNLVAALLVLTLPTKYDVRAERPRKRRILMRAVWLPPMAFIASCALQAGVNGALAVLTFQARGIANGALIFTAAAITTIVFRYPSGRLVEIYGPRKAAIPTALVQAGGCFLAAHATTPWAVITAGICLGLAWAAVVPIGLALMFASSSHGTRGTAMGAYNLAMGGGAALGALVATIAIMAGMGYATAILVCALMPCASLIYLFAAPQKTASRTVRTLPVPALAGSPPNR